MGDIRKMFDPKTVALFGATEAEGGLESILLTNLLRSDRHKTFLVNAQSEPNRPGRKKKKGDEDKTFPVNPHQNEGMVALNCYPDIASVPEKIDLAVIATPAPTVPAIVEACGKAGVEGIVIVSGGFKEVGEDGKRLEEEIKEIRKNYGMRILGPTPRAS